MAQNTSSSESLTTEAGILAYVQHNYPQYVASRAEAISGGNTNFTFRIFLDQPALIDGFAFESLVVKHATSYSSTAIDFKLPVERQTYEAHALRYTNKIFSQSDLVSPPKLFYHDAKNCVMIMSDAGIGSRTLKELLIQNLLPLTLAASLGTELGTFLGRLHTRGRDSDAREMFHHQWGRQISAFYTHGRVLDTLKGDLIKPPINPSESQMQTIEAATKEMATAIQTSNETIVMGDFWTGNIIVQLTKERDSSTPQLKKVLIVDWEIAKLGIAGNDVGQFTAEMYLASAFYPASSSFVQNTLSAFCQSYKQHYSGFHKDLTSIATMHMGSHLITITPTVSSWNRDVERTREAVEEGIAYLETGSTRNWARMKLSLLGGLLED